MRRSERLAAAAAAEDAAGAAGAAAAAGTNSVGRQRSAAAPTAGDPGKSEALLEYQAELLRRLGLDPAPQGDSSNGSSPGPTKRQRRLDGLLLGRTGGTLRGLQTPSRLEVMASIGCHRLPDAVAGALDQFDASLFSAVFNRAGTMVSVACQDASISLFDVDQLLYRQATAAAATDRTSSHYGPQPPLRPRKEIQCQDVGWSIIGSAFSPDGRWIAYSSWSRFLHLANTFGEHCLHERYIVSGGRNHFCLFSLAFSSDGARVVGGGNDGNVHIVHLERKAHTAIEGAHFDDVNAVCFLHADADSLLVSGSDDGLIKLWDLRTPDRARGLSVGHAHGVTSVASKGNGIHVVSNGKDQAAKLWDLRKLRDASPAATNRYAIAHDWDYRWDISAGPASFRRGRGSGSPEDGSLLTFQGHRVARTLIQATFSPGPTTGGRFVMTGSADGSVCVYDTLEAPADDGGGVVRPARRLRFHRDCVRTVASSPHHDLWVSAAWDHRVGLWRFQGGREEKEE